MNLLKRLVSGIAPPGHILIQRRRATITSARSLPNLERFRVPTGEGEALKIALVRVSTSPFLSFRVCPTRRKSWRRLAALHGELARQSANGMYFLGCRDAAKAHHGLKKDSANIINRALAR